MDYTYIEQLLDKYFEYETTLGEEQVLKAFFEQTDVPVQLLKYRQLFQDMAEKDMGDTLGADFDEKILSLIAAEEAKKPIRVKARRVTMQRRLRPLYKAAAVVAVVLALGQAAQMPYTEQQDEQENIADMLRESGVKQEGNAVAQTDSATNATKPVDAPVQN